MKGPVYVYYEHLNLLVCYAMLIGAQSLMFRKFLHLGVRQSEKMRTLFHSFTHSFIHSISVSQQVHNLFQGTFSTEFNLVLLVSIFSILSFP